MAFTKHSLLSYLGLVEWGDIAELTVYRDRYRRIVVYPKQYPKDRYSYLREKQKAAFKAAAVSWNALPDTQQKQWSLAAARASLRMSGYNLFISATLVPAVQAIRTLERQTNTVLLPLSEQPSSSSSSSASS